MAKSTPTPPRAWVPGFLALSAIWGASFLFIKVGLRDLSPVDIALARVALGALPLTAWALLRHDPLPRGRRVWGHLFVVALLFNAVPFSLIAFGETRVPSVLAGLWNATTPLLTLVAVTALLPGERPTARRVAGVLIGFAGVIVVLGPWHRLGGGVLVGDLAVLGASTCYGLAFAYARRNLAGRSESSVSLSAAQLLCATGQLAIAAPLLGAVPHALSADTALSMLGLGVLGTGIAYVLNTSLIRSVGPSLTSTVTYVVPLVATVLGIVVLGEHLQWYEPAGACVVLLGVAVSSSRRRGVAARAGAVAGPARGVTPPDPAPSPAPPTPAVCAAAPPGRRPRPASRAPR